MSASATLLELSWPADRIGEAIHLLARKSGWSAPNSVEAPTETSSHEAGTHSAEQLTHWIDAAAAALDLEAEPVELFYSETDHFLQNAGPALFRLPGSSNFLIVLKSSHRWTSILTPGQNAARLKPEIIRRALCTVVEASVAPQVERILSETKVGGKRAHRARAALFNTLLADARIGNCWIIRSTPAAQALGQARQAGIPGLLAALTGAHVIRYAAWIASWWLLGSMVLHGRFESGWFLAWLLLLISLVPLHLIEGAAAGQISIRAGTILKRRLFAGALKMNRDELRELGIGKLLGRVLESEAVESLALQGGFAGIVAGIEMVMAALLLGIFVGSMLHILLLACALLAVAWVSLSYYRRRSAWTDQRLGMTHQLTERMIGHRTRLAQEPRDKWNENEDKALEGYVAVSKNYDRYAVALRIIPRCFLAAGILGFAPGFANGTTSVAALAGGIGCVLLAYRAFQSLADGVEQFSAAVISWKRLQSLWGAAVNREPLGNPHLAASAAQTAHRENSRLLLVRNLVYRYRGRSEPLFKALSTEIQNGDRILLHGASCEGKSTLAALLSGQRAPESGLLLFRGLDRSTVGASEWRARIISVPQFHENHVFMGSLAFNLLMGRGWPPRQADISHANEICGALGLGPLIERMPGGIHQMVGETGWQLSHGEKGRLFIARALLQEPALLILDESFAALDPHTLGCSLTTVLKTASTLIVIAD
jgi:ATP-binding cassette, subfamily B, bacterial